jgi:1-acyl-sn-glycerol-3-phosphate acyltransferase
LARAAAVPADPDSLASIDGELISAVVHPVDAVGRAWYRLEVEGIDRVPAGPALIVINHNAGISFAEMIAFGAQWYLARGTEDCIHGLAHDGMLKIPGLGNLLVRLGGLRACHENADRAFGAGRKVLVAPGGNLEAFRPFRDRHKINFGGRHGFLKLALRNRVPIVPAVFIGGHETFMILHDGQGLANALGLRRRFRIDTFPLMLALPWGVALGPVFHLPLPCKCKVRFLPPIPLDDCSRRDHEDPKLLDELYSRVVGRMQAALDELASERRWPIIG